MSGNTARTAAPLVGVSKSTAAYYFLRLRMIITQDRAEETLLVGAIEVDESYFGGHRKGKRGRGAAGKVPVFGILKRDGRVYTQVIPNTKVQMLLGIMQERIVLNSIVYTDTYRSYTVLDMSGFKHYRMNHSKRFVQKYKHINSIGNFWNQAKRHVRKFIGVAPAVFQFVLES